MAKNDDIRRIDRESCTWCGHPPHTEKCTQRNRTGKDGTKNVETPCACKKHEWVNPRSPEVPSADGTSSSEGR